MQEESLPVRIPRATVLFSFAEMRVKTGRLPPALKTADPEKVRGFFLSGRFRNVT